jgi:hypothetical protein
MVVTVVLHPGWEGLAVGSSKERGLDLRKLTLSGWAIPT